MKEFIIFIALLWGGNLVYAQTQGDSVIRSIEVGKKSPNLTLTDVHYYSKSRVNLDEFKGKWLIIDCWNRYCSSCVSSFPKIDSLQEQFKNKVQFLLVGYTGSQYVPRFGPDTLRIKQDFEKYRKRLKLDLAIAYDSTLFKVFDVGGCPFIIVIDPNGIIRGITCYMTKENLIEFLSGKTPSLPKVARKSEWLEENEKKKALKRKAL